MFVCVRENTRVKVLLLLIQGTFHHFIAFWFRQMRELNGYCRYPIWMLGIQSWNIRSWPLACLCDNISALPLPCFLQPDPLSRFHAVMFCLFIKWMCLQIAVCPEESRKTDRPLLFQWWNCVQLQWICYLSPMRALFTKPSHCSD